MISKMSKGKALLAATNPPSTPARVLEPNDAVILMLLARYPNQNSDKQDKLVSMLSDEGKLVAKALLGPESGDEFPAPVIATANGLREWVKQLSPTRAHLAKPAKTKRVVKISAVAGAGPTDAEMERELDLETVSA